MRRLLVSVSVSAGVLVGAILLWRFRTLVVLLLLVFVLAAAMRPGVEALARHRVPRSLGVLIHYLAAACLIGLALWLIAPRLATQLAGPAKSGHGTAVEPHTNRGTAPVIRRGIDSLEKRLRRASLSDVARPTLTLSRKFISITGGIAFVLAGAAFWTLERDRAERLFTRRMSAARRRRVVETWREVERRLGAYVRGQLLLMAVVAIVLSAAFRAIGLPYWLAVGIFAGVVEILPIVGPLFAAIVAVGVGLTVSWHLAALAAACVYGLRIIQDYALGPRVLGHAVGLPPLVTLVSVTVVGIVLGPASVPIATPLACILVATLDAVRDPSRRVD